MSDAKDTAAVTTNAVENKDTNSNQVDNQVNAEKSAADSLYPQANAQQDASKDAKPAVEGKEENKDSTKQDQNTDTQNKQDANKVPEKYEFEVDDNTPLTDEHLERIAQYSKERGLTQDAAQKLVDLQAETLKKQLDQHISDFKKTTDTWKQTAQADKEIGGDNFAKNVELAKRVVDKFASDDFKKALNDTGFGNHPELLRTFVRIANAMSEDTLVVPGAQNSRPKSYEDLFYGSKN